MLCSFQVILSTWIEAVRSLPNDRSPEVGERHLFYTATLEQVRDILENGFSENDAANTGMYTAANYLADQPEPGVALGDQTKK